MIFFSFKSFHFFFFLSSSELEFGQGTLWFARNRPRSHVRRYPSLPNYGGIWVTGRARLDNRLIPPLPPKLPPENICNSLQSTLNVRRGGLKVRRNAGNSARSFLREKNFPQILSKATNDFYGGGGPKIQPSECDLNLRLLPVKAVRGRAMINRE